MRKLLTLVIPVLALPALAVVGASSTGGTAAVVAAERAFAARAQVVDARDAFVENFAPDAITFGPGPEPAFPALTEGPDWGTDIRWRPADAGAARAGDLGWTTGPVEYRKDRADAQPKSYGFYTSVWARQPDGGWKVIADIGTRTPPPTQAIPDWTMPRHADRHEGKPWRGHPSARHREKQQRALLEADRTLAAHAARDAAKAFRAALIDDSRVHRDGMPPAVGRNAAFDALRDGATTYSWSARGGRVAASGDLGFTYGSGETRTTSGVTPFHYLAIWERHDERWKLRVLVRKPVPPTAR